jgi:hypothetical protein
MRFWRSAASLSDNFHDAELVRTNFVIHAASMMRLMRNAVESKVKA